MINIPCKKCQKRTDHCHGKCDLYAAYKERCEVLRNKRAMKRDVDCAVGDAMNRIPGKRGI